MADEILALQKTIGNTALSRVLAREAVVPLPGAGTQIIGDDDSDVTFSPWAKFEASNDPADVAVGRATGVQSGGFQSTRHARRRRLRGHALDQGRQQGQAFGSWSTRTSSWTTSSTRRSTRTSPARWSFEADLTGKIKFGPARPESNPADSEHARFQISAVTPNQDSDSGMFQVTASFTGPQDAKSSSKSGGITVTPKDSPVGGGGNYERGTSRTFAAPVLTRTFWVKVLVTDIPPPPKHEPHGKVAFGPISASVTQSHDVKFAVGKANLGGETKLATQEERDLRAWYMQLSPETRKGMHEGAIVPRLNGYTSTTDNAPHNRVLARQRVQAVEQALKDWGVTKFDETAPGEYPYIEEDPKQEVEDPADRRVAIEVDEAPVQIAPAEPDFVDMPGP